MAVFGDSGGFTAVSLQLLKKHHTKCQVKSQCFNSFIVCVPSLVIKSDTSFLHPLQIINTQNSQYNIKSLVWQSAIGYFGLDIKIGGKIEMKLREIDGLSLILFNFSCIEVQLVVFSQLVWLVVSQTAYSSCSRSSYSSSSSQRIKIYQISYKNGSKYTNLQKQVNEILKR